VAKRVLPRAVDRNRTKRLIRNAFRHQKVHLPAVDIVISLRGRKQRGVPENLVSHLEGLWLRLATG
jgi:ribonuclease P protein component